MLKNDQHQTCRIRFQIFWENQKSLRKFGLYEISLYDQLIFYADTPDDTLAETVAFVAPRPPPGVGGNSWSGAGEGGPGEGDDDRDEIPDDGDGNDNGNDGNDPAIEDDDE